MLEKLQEKADGYRQRSGVLGEVWVFWHGLRYILSKMPSWNLCNTNANMRRQTGNYKQPENKSAHPHLEIFWWFPSGRIYKNANISSFSEFPSERAQSLNAAPPYRFLLLLHCSPFASIFWFTLVFHISLTPPLSKVTPSPSPPQPMAGKPHHQPLHPLTRPCLPKRLLTPDEVWTCAEAVQHNRSGSPLVRPRRW